MTISVTFVKSLDIFVKLDSVSNLRSVFSFVPYLGHVISIQGIRPDPSKTEKVKLFPTPSDVTTLRQFVGSASYYRRFVPGFAKIAAPRHALTKKDVPFEWTPECEAAFCKVKELLVTAPVGLSMFWT